MSPPVSRLPPSATRFGPPLQGRDIVRTVLLALALFGVGFIVLDILGTPATTAPARVNYLLGFYAAWATSWLVAIWLIFGRLRGLSFADLGYVVPAPVWAMRGVLAGFMALPVAFILAMLLRPLLGSETSADLQQFFGGPDFSVIQAIAVLLYLGFLVPIAEELVFRGLIFRWLRQRFDFWPAAFISSALFGAAHLRPDQMVVTAVVGLALAWLYEKSRSLASPILMHQTYNSLGLMLQFAYIWFADSSAN